MEMTDERRRTFLDALDGSDNVSVNEWEARFLESNVNRTEFSEKQKEVVKRW